MNDAVRRLTLNSVDLYQCQKYAAILGLNPSKGARSPSLWNAAFYAHQIKATMVPMDIAKIDLPELLYVLNADERFLGGAIAAPYKESVWQLLDDSLTAEAKVIGAVNCIFKKEGRLHGTNTDGEAAVTAFQTKYGSLAGLRVLIIGAGGAGKAVATYFGRAIGPTGSLHIASRTKLASGLLKRIGAIAADWPVIPEELSKFDVIVNCTSIGTDSQVNSSPIDLDGLSQLRSDCIIYDIIYRPCPTLLIEKAKILGLVTLDGVRMNLEQAVLAFSYAIAVPDKTLTRRAMEQTLLTVLGK